MIIIYSLLAGVFFVLADSAINAYLHENGLFPDVFLYTQDQLYLRMLVVASFLTFGLIINRVFKQRLRIEAELVKSREQYSSLVNSTNDSIYVVDGNCMYLMIFIRQKLAEYFLKLLKRYLPVRYPWIMSFKANKMATTICRHSVPSKMNLGMSWR
jgi:hypothetical protein